LGERALIAIAFSAGFNQPREGVVFNLPWGETSLAECVLLFPVRSDLHREHLLRPVSFCYVSREARRGGGVSSVCCRRNWISEIKIRRRRSNSSRLGRRWALSSLSRVCSS